MSIIKKGGLSQGRGDSRYLKLDCSNSPLTGNLGIGETSPTSKLDIIQTGVTSGLSVYSNVGATADESLMTLHADNSAFDQKVFEVKTSADTDRGISFITDWDMPNTFFDIRNAGSFLTTGILQKITAVNVTDTATLLSLVNFGTGANLFVDKNNSGYGIDIDGDANSASDLIGLRVNVANAGAGDAYAAIFETGNVGIGTTTPTSLLEVKGTASYNAHTDMGTDDAEFASKYYVDNRSNVYGEMYIADSADSITINASTEWHAVETLVTGFTEGFTFEAGSDGTVASIADAGGGDITVTDTAHGLLAGDIITMTGLADSAYVGLFEVKTVTTDTFTITATYTATDTGTWQKGSSLTCSKAGIYIGNWSSSGISAVNAHLFDFVPAVNTTVSTKAKARRKFSNVDYGSFSGGGIMSMAVGDVITFNIQNVGATGDITIRTLDLRLHLIN